MSFVFKFSTIVYINKFLTLYNNHLMLVRWPSYYSLHNTSRI